MTAPRCDAVRPGLDLAGTSQPPRTAEPAAHWRGQPAPRARARGLTPGPASMLDALGGRANDVRLYGGKWILRHGIAISGRRRCKPPSGLCAVLGRDPGGVDGGAVEQVALRIGCEATTSNDAFTRLTEREVGPVLAPWAEASDRVRRPWSSWRTRDSCSSLNSLASLGSLGSLGSLLAWRSRGSPRPAHRALEVLGREALVLDVLAGDAVVLDLRPSDYLRGRGTACADQNRHYDDEANVPDQWNTSLGVDGRALSARYRKRRMPRQMGQER